MLTEDQKELRRSGIGGSDASVIACKNKYKSLVDLYLIKRGEKAEDRDPDDVNLLRSDPRYWGNVQEPVIAQQYEFFEGKKVEIEPNLLRHKHYPWMIANIDRRIPQDNGVLEIKTASEYKLKEWGYDEYTDNIPDPYLYQCMHYAIVTDCSYVDCAVLIGGNKFRVYRYERNAEAEQLLIELESDFWHRNVLAGVIPPINKYEEACRAFKHSDKSVKTLPPELIDHVKSIQFTNKKIKELEEQLDFDKAKICEYLGESEILLSPAGMQLASWKEQSSERLDTKSFKQDNPDLYKQYIKTSSFRVLRLKEFKNTYE